MKYKLVPFKKSHIDDAVKLFIENYARQRQRLPLLPSRAINEPDWIADALSHHEKESGVALFDPQRMVGYMTTGHRFPFKGVQAALCPEYAHASVEKDESLLYQLMYMALAEEWAAKGIHLHIVCHLAGNASLKETLFQLGFGAIVAERLRDFSPVQGVENIQIVREKEVSRLVDLQIEHNRYYKDSPIFILKDTDQESILADLEKHSQNDELLVYYEDSDPAACFIVGESAEGEEGFLLQKTATAQIKSAYAKPHVRGKGIGKALLHHALEWSKERGYKRLFVEHETANFYGGNFWRRHFSPYLYASVRYIDNRI